MGKYKLDKKWDKAQTFEEADDNRNYWLGKDGYDRLLASWYMHSTFQWKTHQH